MCQNKIAGEDFTESLAPDGVYDRRKTRIILREIRGLSRVGTLAHNRIGNAPGAVPMPTRPRGTAGAPLPPPAAAACGFKHAAAPATGSVFDGANMKASFWLCTQNGAGSGSRGAEWNGW